MNLIVWFLTKNIKIVQYQRHEKNYDMDFHDNFFLLLLKSC
jgi:hypothetical protein